MPPEQRTLVWRVFFRHSREKPANLKVSVPKAFSEREADRKSAPRAFFSLFSVFSVPSVRTPVFTRGREKKGRLRRDDYANKNVRLILALFLGYTP